MKHILVGIASFLLLLSPKYCTAQQFCRYLHHDANYKTQETADLRSDSFDILSYSIEASFLDYTNLKQMDAATTIQVIKLLDQNSIRLDLLGLNVTAVDINTAPVTYNHSGENLVIDIPSGIMVNDTFSIKVQYNGTPKRDAQWGGFYFMGVYAFNLGVAFADDPHNYGKVWFPCFDNFVDRALYDYIITVDSGIIVYCNGSLQEKVNLPNQKTKFHWKMNDEIPTYLSSIAMAPYKEISYTYRNIPVTLAALEGDTANLRSSFIHLNPCIDGFVEAFGDHPYERIGYNIVPFNAGAMEHPTNIAYSRNLIANGGLQGEHTMAHEFGHHWWGDNVTCSTQEDMWINEGWASFTAHLFTEIVYGKNAYHDRVAKNHRQIVHYAHIRDGGILPVSGIGHANTYGMHVYEKGADMVHTLRFWMGDAEFFEACRTFQSDFGNSAVSTDDLMNHFQKHTTRNVKPFFEEWIKQPGFAHFYILSAEKQGENYQVRFKQDGRFTEQTYHDVPYRMTVFNSSFERYDTIVVLTGPDQSHILKFPIEPAYWALDIEGEVSDAISDDYKVITATGDVEFENGLMQLEVSSLSDSALVRVEHHWTSPDHFFNKIEGLAMSTERYWNVEGVWPDDFNASAVIEYNGLSSPSNPEGGYLDNKLIRITEDSLVLLYRPNAISDWQIYNDYEKMMGSVFNKSGLITINNLKKGQYALAMYDNQLLSGIDNFDKNAIDYQIYPNPAKNQLTITFVENHDCCNIEITDQSGKVVIREKIKSKHKKYTIDLAELSDGVYYVGIITDGLAYNRKRLVIAR